MRVCLFRHFGFFGNYCLQSITNVVTSRPRDAPPLVFLHGMLATLTRWSPNIADLSKDYRIYAIDIMGQPSKSVQACDSVRFRHQILENGYLEDQVLCCI